MYSQVYGTARPVIVDPAKPTVIHDQRAPITGKLIAGNNVDRLVIMETRHAGRPTEHTTVRVELVQPACGLCTGQHRGECY